MKTYRFFVVALAVCLLCSGCSLFSQSDKYEYSEVYLRVSEPYGLEFLISGNVNQTVVGNHTYQFDTSISKEDRADFITGQEKLCELLDSHGVSAAGLTFRILADYTNWTDSENNVAYFGLNTMSTWAQALTTVQVSLGDYTNYGYLYALANQIAAELGWQQETVDETSINKLALDSSLLNLVYPCFDEAYTDAENIAVCKATAKKLLSGLENTWSEEEFLQARQDYAQTRGIDFQPTYLTFAYYSKSCPLKFRTRYLEVFKDYTYEQDYYVTVGYVLEDYFISTDKIIQTFHWLDEKLVDLRNTFGVEKTELTSVQLKSDVGGQATLSAKGVYEFNKDSCTIRAKTIHCLAHEYVHYLYWLSGGTADPAYEQWINEVVAHYYAMAGGFEDYCLIGANADPERLDAIEKLIGEDYDEPSDYIKFTRKVIRKRENVQYPYYLKTEYILCPAFGSYFICTYGEETFLDCMLAPSKVKELTGKTMDEIIDDWCLNMEDPAND